MKTRRIGIGPRGHFVVLGAVTFGRLVAGICVALAIAAAIGGAWLIWQAPHCRPVAAHAYYTPLAPARCERNVPTSAATRVP
jgi:hypothetical protein